MPYPPAFMTSLVWLLPFVGLLLAIALLPLAASKLWHRHEFQGAVAFLAALPVLVRFSLRGGEGGEGFSHVSREWVSFVLLLGSLYLVTSGIRISGNFPARPTTNAALLLAGGILASIVGTTGASMLLIRLLLDINAERRRVAHTVVFFILVVSNIGGALTPIGDPPLFLGYLAGVPFLFTLRLLPHWALSLAVLLTVYLVLDVRMHRLEALRDQLEDETTRRPLRVEGAANLPLLLAIPACTVVLPWPWREVGYVSVAFLTFLVTPRTLRKETGFSWGPILEVAILFAGIFVAMEPAVAILRERAPSLGITSPAQFFWASGALSPWLDNAPTYAAFLAIARGLGRAEVAGAPADILVAISAGSVFFGAMTYVGNGPNFLVKAIAQSRGVRMPSFFVYLAWAAALLVPLFLVLTLVFFAGG